MAWENSKEFLLDGREQTRVPVLFNYAENDLFFSPRITRQWFDRYAAGGADAEYILQPAFGRDGHYLFSDVVGVRYWLPTVERFFARHKLPFERLDAADEPGRTQNPIAGVSAPSTRPQPVSHSR